MAGTLFLDEIGECDPAMQAKLLRVLQPPDNDPCHRVFYRVGESKPMTSDVRIIAATNRDLNAAIARGDVPGRPVLPGGGDHNQTAAASGTPGRHPLARRTDSWGRSTRISRSRSQATSTKRFLVPP